MLSVAWGRLEGHIIGNLLTIMNLLGTASQKPLPFRWEERLTLWKKGFSSRPSLQIHKERAVVFMKSIDIRVSCHWRAVDKVADQGPVLRLMDADSRFSNPVWEG